MAKYPQAIQRPSAIKHPAREETRGVVMHWTAGHKGGDLSTLDGPNVDCHFYVDKDGEVYQFLDSGSQAWHAFHTANHTCIGIEHESFGEAYTPAQFEASARLVAWLAKLYNIPVKHVNPHTNWKGLFGHVDLSLPRPAIDGNNHSDTVPAGTGWPAYLTRVKALAGEIGPPQPIAKRPPGADKLQLLVKPKGGPQRAWTGWENAISALKWIDKNGLKPTATASLTLNGQRYDTPAKVTAQAKQLVAKYLS